MTAGQPAPAPLNGIRVVEIASLAPGPFGCMMLADLGADVVLVERPLGQKLGATRDPMLRGRRSIVLNLKEAKDAEILLRLIDGADVLVEGFRPGVAERLGVGPEICMARNPALIYARMTGWGQTGPLAMHAGHDINYLAVSGALAAIGPADRPPPPPLNYVADFGGGGMLLAVGILAALVERARSGAGQVLDVAMVDGAALMTTPFHGMRAEGKWHDERGENLIDGSAPFYRCFETADGQFVAVGAIEPVFYAALIKGLGLDAASLPAQMDKSSWPALRKKFEGIFRQRPLAEWKDLFAADACVTPVLCMNDAVSHPHSLARSSFLNIEGVVQPAPAPRFSRSKVVSPKPPAASGEHRAEILAELGISEFGAARDGRHE